MSPLRVVHTSDWHLGQELHGFDRTAEHRAFLDWLATLLREREADALLVAGDVFDGANPSIPAQRLLFELLHRFRVELPRLDVVLVAGNHDSGARLELPAPLLDPARFTVVGSLPRTEGRLDLGRLLRPLRDRDGEVRALCAAIPYPRPGELPPPIEGEHPVASLYAAAARWARAESPRPLVAMGHLHVAGGEICADSERSLVIGNEEAIPASYFGPEIAYVALGHLHRPQSVGGRANVRYSGAPFPMSVSERAYTHGVVVVDLDDDGVRDLETAAIPRPAGFLRVPDRGALSLEEALAALATLELPPCPRDLRPYLEVALDGRRFEPDARRRIDLALEGRPARLTRIARVQAGDGGALADHGAPAERLGELRPEAVFERCWEEARGGAPTDDLMREFLAVVAEVEAGDAP